MATTGNDTISGTAGNDTVDALTGSDFVFASAGSDTIDGGYNDSSSYYRLSDFNDGDTLVYNDLFSLLGVAESSVRITADLQAGTIIKRAGSTVVGTDNVVGIDRLVGAGGADRMSGRNFWDYETFQGYQGNDTIDGRGGNDQADYLDTDFNVAGIVVNLAAGTVTGDAAVGSDTLREIEFVGGTHFGDRYDATGYGGASTNRNSFGEDYNGFSPLGGDDTVIGNGQTYLNYSGVGGAISVNLALQTGPAVAANVIVNAASGSFSQGYAPGNDLVSGVFGVRGGRFNDTLAGGGHVNTAGSTSTVSGDASFERFRGDGGNDSISGGTGMDRAEYGGGGAGVGISVNLAAGTVTGDVNAVGTDTLRGIETVGGTPFDDTYNAVGFTLSNAASPSANQGDVVVQLPVGETLPSLAFNEFRASAGDDSVTGNGATRISLNAVLVETLAGTSSIATFTSAQGGSISYGLTDGGLGTIAFSGVYAVRGSAGNDSITGAAGFQSLQGYYGNDTLNGGDGNDFLYGHMTSTSDGALNLTTLFTDNDLMFGGAGNDVLHGHFGNDTLNGGSGTDTMYGGTGNDTYIVNATADKALEDSGAGTDTVQSSAGYTLGVNVERLTLTGAGNVNGVGNTLGNLINGNTGHNKLSGVNGNDSLNGGDGNDTLNGGLGKDVIAGGAGGDAIVFSTTLNATTNVDTIAGFASGVDQLQLDDLVFGGIGGLGGLAPTAFVAGTAATTAAHRVIYDQASGSLWFDADGSGAASTKVLFAQLGAGAVLVSTDVFVV